MLVYFLSITRLFIAASIVAFSFRYLYEKKMNKYILCILIAMMFHYSAGIMLIFAYLTMQGDVTKKIKRLLAVVIIILPICMVLLSNFIFPMMGNKYSEYIIKYSGMSLGTFDKLPFLAFFAYMYYAMKKMDDNIKIHILFYAMITIISIYTTFMEFGRTQWYFFFSACILFSRLYKVIKLSKYRKTIIIYVPILVIYAIIYMNSIINNTIRADGISNYVNILFK